MKKFDNITMKTIVGSLFIVLSISLLTSHLVFSLNGENEITITNNRVIASQEKQVSPEDIKESAILDFIELNNSKIEFFRDSFQINDGFIENQLVSINENREIFDENDAFNQGTTFLTVDEQLLNYIVSLLNTNPEVFANNVIPTYASKDYMIALIDYFCNFYPAVDPVIAKTIANVESGYAARSMLNKNNIFGGMSGGYVISYKTIEYGVFSYIKLLNNGYFSQGLTTVESIGQKYNPVFENGVKVASPSWVTKIYNYKYQFEGEFNVTFEDLIALR